MRGRLSSLNSGPVISPLIDVIFNAMAAMFIFLVIYIAIVRPKEGPPPLRIVNEHLPDAVWYKPYQSCIAACGGVAPYRFSMEGQLPEGFELVPGTGLCHGVPTTKARQEKSGVDFTFTAVVTDNSRPRQVASRQFRLHVAPVAVTYDPLTDPLRIRSVVKRLPEAVVGHPYEVSVGILGGIEPYRVRVVGGLPKGLRCDGGTLTGVPEQPGDYSFTIEVSDQQDRYGILAGSGRPILSSCEYELHVVVLTKPSLEALLPEGRVGETYEACVAAQGGKSPYRWGHGPDPLPNGLTLNPANGTITGTPTESGSHKFILGVQDQLGQTAAADVTLTVLPKRPDAVITAKVLPTARVGVPYSATLGCEGMIEPVRWQVGPSGTPTDGRGPRGGDLPPGLQSQDQTIFGTPTAHGEWNVSVTATDVKGKAVRTDYALKVLPRIPPLELVPLGPRL